MLAFASLSLHNLLLVCIALYQFSYTFHIIFILYDFAYTVFCFAWFMVVGMRVALPVLIFQILAFHLSGSIINCKIRRFNLGCEADFLVLSSPDLYRHFAFFPFFLLSFDLCLEAQVSSMWTRRHCHSGAKFIFAKFLFIMLCIIYFDCKTFIFVTYILIRL